MTDEKRERILDLLSKLEALANDKSTTPEESALAAARMQQLATKYNIELAELDTYDPEDLPEIQEGNLYTENGTQINTWKVWLAGALARFNSCDIVVNKARRRGFQSNVTVIGNVDNARIVRYMFGSICKAIERACRWHMRAGYGKGKRWSNSFKLGAVSEVEKRLKEAHATARETASSTALARIDAEAERVKDWISQNLNLRKGPARGGTVVDGGAIALGKQTGRKVDLGGSAGGALGAGRKSLPPG